MHLKLRLHIPTGHINFYLCPYIYALPSEYETWIQYWCQYSCYQFIFRFGFHKVLLHYFSITAMCGLDQRKICVHGSDSLQSEKREISFFFDEEIGTIYSLYHLYLKCILICLCMIYFCLLVLQIFTVTFILFTSSCDLYGQSYNYLLIS